jgi:predicted ATPase
MEIKNITISNYKSIKSLVGLELGKINILIGSNGSGKSNFISFLRLLKSVADKNLQNYVAENAGANRVLHFGTKKSHFLSGRIEFTNGNAYQIELKPNTEDGLFFTTEIAAFKPLSVWHNLKVGSVGYAESKLDELIDEHKKKHNYGGIPEYVKIALSKFEIYHFHDTSRTSPSKQQSNISDNRTLRRDGSNLPSFLYFLKLKHPLALNKITSVIKEIAPFFSEFILEPSRLNEEMIRLEWKAVDSSEYFNAHQLSDGTLRMICLVTLMLQPDPPKTIIIDEPELGLHPKAIHLLANLIDKASKLSQVIISTQSVTLVNQFSYEHLVVTEQTEGESLYGRLAESEVREWVDAYGSGEAWEKNIFGARP